jgi:bud site selection protein 31
MPKVRRSKKSPPEGWELIEPTLEELEQKMREGIVQQ